MSALGQKQTCALQNVMSALHPIATAKGDSRKGAYPLYSRKRHQMRHNGMSAKGQKRSRRIRPFIEKRYRRDIEHARALCSDLALVYWLARRSRTTIQIMVAIVSVPPRADASAQ